MTVKARIRRGGAAAALATLLTVFAGAAIAQDDPANAVAARVNGEVITEGDVAQAAQDFQQQLAQVPRDQWRSRIVDLLIEIKLASAAAKAESLDKDPAAAKRMQQVVDRALRLEFIRAKVVAPITEEAVHKRFDEELAKFVPGDQYQASHILVKTEDEAKAIIADLDKGGDFAAIAKEKSLDTGSGANGGELGFFSPAQMVKPFGDAVVATPVGTYTKTPIQSEFGWHVIKVEATRKEPPPTFEERAQALREAMIAELFTSTMDDLRSKATIEIVQPEKPAGDAAPATPAPATPPAK